MHIHTLDKEPLQHASRTGQRMTERCCTVCGIQNAFVYHCDFTFSTDIIRCVVIGRTLYYI